MSGIEAGFFARVGTEPEAKKVKGGTLDLLTFNAVVDQGDDKPGQWVKITLFGERAAEQTGRISKGDRIFCQGWLKLDQWQKQDGTQGFGLSLAANICSNMARLGRGKPRKANGVGQTRPTAHPDLDDALPWN